MTSNYCNAKQNSIHWPCYCTFHSHAVVNFCGSVRFFFFFIVRVLLFKINWSRWEDWDPYHWFYPTNMCACIKPGPWIQLTYVMVFFFCIYNSCYGSLLLIGSLIYIWYLHVPSLVDSIINRLFLDQCICILNKIIVKYCSPDWENRPLSTPFFVTVVVTDCLLGKSCCSRCQANICINFSSNLLSSISVRSTKCLKY